MLTAKEKQVCDATVKTSESEHQVVFWNVLELVFNLFCLFMLDILTNGRGPNKVLLSTSRVSLRTSFMVQKLVILAHLGLGLLESLKLLQQTHKQPGLQEEELRL